MSVAEQTEYDLANDIHETLGYLFFAETHGCIALFELLGEFPQILSSPLIDAAALGNAVWQNHPDYAAIYNPNPAVVEVLAKKGLSISEYNANGVSPFLYACFYNFSSDVTKKFRYEAYHPFANKNGLTDNVNYFNSYNYTVYAPDNDAMQKAYALGLPKWSDIKAIYDPIKDQFETEKAAKNISPEIQAARDKALAMVEAINDFIRYHFQDNSVYSDNVIDAGVYSTACTDTLGIRQRLTVGGGGGQMTVTDNSGQVVTIDASSTSKYVNIMARDYELNKKSHVINNSSFAVVHQISTPLNSHADGARYDALWNGANARARLGAYRKQFENRFFDRYDVTLKY